MTQKRRVCLFTMVSSGRSMQQFKHDLVKAFPIHLQDQFVCAARMHLPLAARWVEPVPLSCRDRGWGCRKLVPLQTALEATSKLPRPLCSKLQPDIISKLQNTNILINKPIHAELDCAPS